MNGRDRPGWSKTVANIIYLVERMCKAAAVMARTKYGDAARLLRYIVECDMFSYIHAGPGRTRTFILLSQSVGVKLIDSA